MADSCGDTVWPLSCNNFVLNFGSLLIKCCMHRLMQRQGIPVSKKNISREINGIAHQCTHQANLLTRARHIRSCGNSAHRNLTCPVLVAINRLRLLDTVITSVRCPWVECKIVGCVAPFTVQKISFIIVMVKANKALQQRMVWRCWHGGIEEAKSRVQFHVSDARQ
jgi:hypothetical protein